MMGPIEIDCTITELHSWTSTVTRVPVESGADRSQHIIDNPYMLSVEAVISDIPMDPRKQAQAAAFNIAGSLVSGSPALIAAANQAWPQFQGASQKVNSAFSGAGGEMGVAFGAGSYYDPRNAVGVGLALQSAGYQPPNYTANDKYRVALARILNLRESRVPFDWVSPLGVVENLVFETFEVPVDQTSDLLFRATFVEFVETGLTRTRSLAGPQVDLSSDPDNIGSRTTKEVALVGLFTEP